VPEPTDGSISVTCDAPRPTDADDRLPVMDGAHDGEDMQGDGGDTAEPEHAPAPTGRHGGRHTHGHAHAHGHRHSTDGRRGWRGWVRTDDDLVTTRIGRIVWIAVVVCAVITVVGLIALWPTDRGTSLDPAVLDGDPLEAVVTSVSIAPCSGTDPSAAIDCRFVELEIRSGDTAGDIAILEASVGGAGATPDPGDEILVLATDSGNGTLYYSFYEFQRRTPLLLLALLFVAAVVVLGRWRGVGAVTGLAASFAIIGFFVLPSLLEGNNPVAVALVGASVVAFIALFLAHGLTLETAVALLASFAALAITGLLGWMFVAAAKFTGYTEEYTFFLDALGRDIDPRGLILAGVVIGSLGVLDDVTVTQVSAVWTLRDADPSASSADLYRSALRIGRDHISSTVNTLFLAYAGASLPLLLLFSEANQSLGSVVVREAVAVEIVRALVGSIGLVASVPISTWLASQVLARRAPATATG
jgi:uncharacterized membrane protein